MCPKSRVILYAASLSVPLGAVDAAMARSADAGVGGGRRPIEEITVTAQKFEQTANTVPMSITVATGEELSRAGIVSVEDLPKITPGFTVVQSPTGANIYTLRGVGFNDSGLGTRPAVTVYVDEAPIPFAAMTRGAGLDVERVEVLKGPQGTLFGANSTGGAINYIAAKPTDTLEADVSSTYGRFDEFNVSGAVSGPITDTLSMRFAVEHQGMGDWQKSVTRSDSAGQRDFSNGRVSLLWEPQRLRVLLTAQHWVDRSDALVGQAIRFDPRFPGLATPEMQDFPYGKRGSRSADWDEESDLEKDNRLTMLTGRIDYDLGDSVTLTSLTSYSDFEYHVLSEADGIPIDNTAFVTDSTNETLTQELRLAAVLDGLRFIVGANYQRDKPAEDTVQSLLTATPIVALSAGFGEGTPLKELLVTMRQKTDIYAAFGNVEYDLTPRLTLQGGLRYTRAEIDFRGCLAVSDDGSAAPAYTNLINAQRAARGLPAIDPLEAHECTTMDVSTDPPTLLPGYVTTPYDEDNFSWRAGVQFMPTDGTMLYANVSRGYKMGGHPFINATFSAALTPAKQESVLAYEAGFKAGLLDRLVQLNGAVFYYDYKDKQEVGTTIDPVIGRLGGLANIPKARSYGAELQIDAELYEGLTIQAAGSYVRAEVLGNYTDTNAVGETQNFHKTSLANAPRWQFNGTVRYQWGLNSRIDAFVSGSMTYQSDSPSRLGELPGYEIPAYELVDLVAGIQSRSGGWSAYMWGRNVFDKVYVATERSGIDTDILYMGRPRTFGVTARFSY